MATRVSVIISAVHFQEEVNHLQLEVKYQIASSLDHTGTHT